MIANISIQAQTQDIVPTIGFNIEKFRTSRYHQHAHQGVSAAVLCCCVLVCVVVCCCVVAVVLMCLLSPQSVLHGVVCCVVCCCVVVCLMSLLSSVCPSQCCVLCCVLLCCCVSDVSPLSSVCPSRCSTCQARVATGTSGSITTSESSGTFTGLGLDIMLEMVRLG